MTFRRFAPVWVVIAAAAASFLVACGGDDSEGADPSAEPIEVRIEITETGIDAPQRPRIPLGSEVSIIFSAEEPDDAHLHGYDLWSSIGPEAENRIDFTADQPGIFLVESERNLVYLTELVVQ